MLGAKLRGEPFVTEVPLVEYEVVPPAPPLANLREAKLAVVTTSGLVPMGNPDRLRRSYAAEWKQYDIAGKTRLASGDYEVVHGGYEAQYANANPNYVLPLDALTELQHEGAYGSLHPYFYTTAGVGTPTNVGERFGQEIAADLQAADVDGVVLGRHLRHLHALRCSAGQGHRAGGHPRRPDHRHDQLRRERRGEPHGGRDAHPEPLRPSRARARARPRAAAAHRPGRARRPDAARGEGRRSSAPSGSWSNGVLSGRRRARAGRSRWRTACVWS